MKESGFHPFTIQSERERKCESLIESLDAKEIESSHPEE